MTPSLAAVHMTIRRSTVLAILILSGVAASSAFADDTTTIHSCVHQRNGNVRIVDPNEACRSNESLLTWPSVKGAGLTVVDSVGQVVGPLVFPGTNQFGSTANLPAVAFYADGIYVILGVSRDFLCAGHNAFSSLGCSGTVFYATSDCSGQPYLAPFQAPMGNPGRNLFGMAATLWNGDGSRQDYYAIPGTAQQVSTGSRLEQLPAETRCITEGGSGEFMPALRFDLSVFKPPFSVH